ncbi:Sorbose reductase sou1 [Arthrobotrys megalospora]
MEELIIPGQKDGIFKLGNTKPSSNETKVFPLLSLKGRTAIVTGAAAGIGFAAVEAFAEAGANVALWYNTNTAAIEKAAELSKAYGVTCKAYQVKITDETAVKEAIDTAINDLNGRLDIFVANAGIPWLHGPIIGSDTDLYRNLFDINLTSVYFAAKVAGHHFRRQSLEGTTINGKQLDNYDRGSFIITTSIAGMRQLLPHAGTPYAMTKAALIHLAKCLAVEWVQFARVNAISPAYITTDMLELAPEVMRTPWSARTPMGREGTVNECKAAYLYLASDAASYTTGLNLVIDGGYTCA